VEWQLGCRIDCREVRCQAEVIAVAHKQPEFEELREGRRECDAPKSCTRQERIGILVNEAVGVAQGREYEPRNASAGAGVFE
jgi:hypothetical protein